MQRHLALPLTCVWALACTPDLGDDPLELADAQHDADLHPADPEADLEVGLAGEQRAIYEELAARHGSRLSPSDPLRRPAQALAAASVGLNLQIRAGHVERAFGLPLAGVELDAPDDASAAERAAELFLRDHAALFGSTPEQLVAGVELARVRDSGSLRLDFNQVHEGLPVIDGDFALGFDRRGRLTRLLGSPWPVASLPSGSQARLEAEDAVALALAAARAQLELGDDRLATTQAEPELVIRGRDARLLWRVRLSPVDPGGVTATVLLDAGDGALVEFDDEAAFATRMLPIKRFRHANGEDQDTVVVDDEINTDIYGQMSFGGVSYCRYGLQRLGSGRARMWNGRSVSSIGTPSFVQVLASDYQPCNLEPTMFTFTNDPSSDPNWLFNAQQTFRWAQSFKSMVDYWGRQPNSYGHYPIDDPARRINAEVVVNASGFAEGYWCNGQVRDPGDPSSNIAMHGCFRGNIPSSWFLGHPAGTGATVPAVFFFNHHTNASSPQHWGAEISPDFGIIVHEVGHYLSWTYGGWGGPSANMRSSINEGMSMVLPALYAKQYWGSAVGYFESEDVSTGSFAGESDQWRHHELHGTWTYDTLDCSSTDPYKLAWPFVQAMWSLMNNREYDGSSVWMSSSDADDNVADLIMYALYNDTANSTMNWSTLAWDLLYYQIDRHLAGTERSPELGWGSYSGVYRTFAAHGLLDDCIP